MVSYASKYNTNYELFIWFRNQQNTGTLKKLSIPEGHFFPHPGPAKCCGSPARRNRCPLPRSLLLPQPGTQNRWRYPAGRTSLSYPLEDAKGTLKVAKIDSFLKKSRYTAVLQSRHFFGRLRLWKSKVPEPTPAPTKLGRLWLQAKKGGSRRLRPNTLTVFILSS